MKGRKWVLVILFIAITIICSIAVAIRFFHVDRKIREYINETVSAFLGGDFESSSVYILPWSFGVRDARLRLRGTPVIIEAKRIRIEFNIWSILKNDFRLVTGTKNIFFDEPRFIWLLDAEEGKPGKTDDDRGFELGTAPEISLKELPSVRFDIVKGSFVFTRGDSTLVFADNIGGWLDSRSTSVITLNFEGRMLSDSTNTTFKGVVDRNTDTATLDIAGSTCDFSHRGIEVLSGDILPESGFLDFTLQLKRSEGKFTQSGTYSIKDGSFIVKDSGISVSDVNISGRINESELLFDSATGKIWNVTPELSGRLLLKPEPALNLVLDTVDIDLTSLLSEILPDNKTYPEGQVKLASTIEGPLRDLSVRMNISSDSLRYGNLKISDTTAAIILASGEVNIENFNAVCGDLILKGHGNAGVIHELPIQTSVQSISTENDFYFFMDARKVSDPSKIFSLSLDGTSNPEKSEYSARLGIVLNPSGTMAPDSQDNMDFNKFEGSIILKDETLEYAIGNSTVNFEGTVKDVFSNIEIKSELSLTQFPLLHYFGVKNAGFFVNGNGDVFGDFDRLSVAGDFGVHAGKNLNTIISGEAVVENLLKNSRTVTVEAKLDNHRLRYSHPMVWELSLHSDSLVTSAVINEPAGAVLWLEALNETGELSGTLALDELPLEWIIDIFKREEFSHRGKLTGEAEIGGTVKNPHFNTPERIQVTGLNIGGLDNLTGSGHVSGNFGELVFTDLNVSRNGKHIMHTDSRWEKGKPYILEATGKNIPLGAISDIISKDRITDGDTDYTATLIFTRKSGTIDGDFKVNNGHFLDVPFDEATGKLGGGSEGFEVTGFTIGREGLFSGKGSASSGYFWKDVTEAPGLKMNLFFQGDLVRTLPHLTGAVKKASGESQLTLEMGGTWQEPVVMGGELYLTGGVIEPSFLFGEVKNVNATFTIEPGFETVSGSRAVRIRGEGSILGKKLIVRNVFAGAEEWNTIDKPELLSVTNGKVNLDFGVITGRIDSENQRDTSIELNVPGFMKPKETGTFLLSGETGEFFFVGAADAGDYLTPYISGNITVLSGDIAYPLLDIQSSGADTDFLKDIFWDLRIIAGSNVNYKHEENIKWKVGGTTVSRTLTKIDENSEFAVYGRISDGSFRVTGNARSTSGTFSYYGTEFDIERAEFELDTVNQTKPASLTARARTVVYDDSTGIDTAVYLNLFFIDEVSGQRKEVLGRTEVRYNNYLKESTSITIDAGALGILQLEFTSSNPSDDTMQKILARLGISPENIIGVATGAFTKGVDNYYFDMWMRPFEDAVRKYTRFDVVRFTPSVLGNIMRSRLGFTSRFGPEDDNMLFDGSRIMLGEYFLDDWFLSYRGQYGLGQDFLRRRERGFYHEIGLQYILKGNTRFQFNYNYDDIIGKGEKRLEIRHDFEF